MFELDILSRTGPAADNRSRPERAEGPEDASFAEELRRVEESEPEAPTSSTRSRDPVGESATPAPAAEVSAGQTEAAPEAAPGAADPAATLALLQIDGAVAQPEAPPLAPGLDPVLTGRTVADPELAQTPTPAIAPLALVTGNAPAPASSEPLTSANEARAIDAASLLAGPDTETGLSAAPETALSSGLRKASSGLDTNAASGGGVPAQGAASSQPTANGLTQQPATAAATPLAATAITPPPVLDPATARAAGSSPSGATPPQTAAQSQATTLVQVQSRIIERFDGRAQRFEVRLDPPELGRVDVRIEIGSDKRVHAVLAAQDGAALNDLMRGARALEQALAKAGVDLADNGLSFELASDDRNASGRDPYGDTGFARRDLWSGMTLVDVPVAADPGLPAYAARAYALGRLNMVA
jgi:flagellar hook-length control protein FliK